MKQTKDLAEAIKKLSPDKLKEFAHEIESHFFLYPSDGGVTAQDDPGSGEIGGGNPVPDANGNCPVGWYPDTPTTCKRDL